MNSNLGGELLASNFKDTDSILFSNNKVILYKISQNYQPTKFRALLKGEMKGKIKLKKKPLKSYKTKKKRRNKKET